MMSLGYLEQLFRTAKFPVTSLTGKFGNTRKLGSSVCPYGMPLHCQLVAWHAYCSVLFLVNVKAKKSFRLFSSNPLAFSLDFGLKRNALCCCCLPLDYRCTASIVLSRLVPSTPTLAAAGLNARANARDPGSFCPSAVFIKDFGSHSNKATLLMSPMTA